MHLNQERIAEIFKTYGGSEKNTGSVSGQIALLTERIKHLTGHLKTHKKDFSTQKGLLQLVGKRKKLLAYLKRRKLEEYRSLVTQLGFRK